MKRFISAVVSAAMALSFVFTVHVSELGSSATQMRKSNFNKSYTITGHAPTDMVNIAKAQLGMTGSQLGYSEHWCANFVSDCADLAGQSAAIPRSGAVSHEYSSSEPWYGVKQTILRAGGTVVSSPQPGDIVIWKHTGISHVEIVSRVEGGVIYSIGGNNGGTGSPKTNYVAKEKNVYSVGSVDFFLRPKYSGSSQPVIDNGTKSGCFPRCESWHTSLVDALASVGADTSKEYRSKIAAANNVQGYSFTAEQNTKLLNLLKSGDLKKPGAEVVPVVVKDPEYKESYFPACNSGYASLVDALNSLGIDSSKSYRARIAAANGISNYNYSAEDNTKMLDLLKAGKLINPDGKQISQSSDTNKYYPACSSGYASLVDALDSIGVDSSKSNRAKIAQANGISNYSYSADQNTQMLNLLKAGKLIRAGYVPAPVIVNYTVALDANGGSSGVKSLTIASNSNYSNLPTPTREGYSFAGWYTAASGGSKITNGMSLVSAADHKLFAHWTANRYTVYYDNNDGSGITESKQVTYDGTYGTLPSRQKTGYSFLGWYKDQACTRKVAADTAYNLSDNSTLYAKWDAVKYNVALVSEGEKVSEVGAVYDCFYGDLPVLRESGKVFDGWYTSDGRPVNDETVVKSSAAHTLYAKWHPVLCLDKSSASLKNGEQFTITANVEELTFTSDDTDVAVVSSSGVVTAIGEGTAVITVTDSYAASEKLVITVLPAIVKGDCNGDGKLNISDAVVLQRYLLGCSETADMDAIDLCADGRIDSFDMVILRQLLVEVYPVFYSLDIR